MLVLLSKDYNEKYIVYKWVKALENRRVCTSQSIGCLFLKFILSNNILSVCFALKYIIDVYDVIAGISPSIREYSFVVLES